MILLFFRLDAPGSKELAIALMDGQRFRLRGYGKRRKPDNVNRHFRISCLKIHIFQDNLGSARPR
jgi:hypothetical protein